MAEDFFDGLLVGDENGIVGESCHNAQELSVVQEIRPKHFGDGENPLGVRNVGEELLWSSSEKIAARLAPQEGHSPRPLHEKE